MYKLKQMVKRGSAFAGAVGLLAGVGTSAVPVLVHADTLNPLTERSLTLSSSSPGWSFTDGSGNTLYAPPNSGANGKQTANYYSFKPSSTGSINALSFQYCTQAAGLCEAPGDDGFSGSAPTKTRNADTTSASDLKIVASAVGGHVPAEISSGNWTTISGRSDEIPNRNDSEGNFVVLVNGTYSSGWTFAASNQEENANGNVADVGNGLSTGKNNLITLKNVSNSGNGVTFTAGQTVVVKFFATDLNYITNPGSGAFFVKINDYEAPPQGSGPYTLNNADVNPITGTANVVDGGVTVANVMNESIAIQTKVLETMDFSVGTVDPDTLTSDGTGSSAFHAGTGQTNHGQCDPVLPALTTSDPHNILYMGETDAEHSLQTNNTFATHSYWRLSSNSSGGATVYYSGNTLYNTEGDNIDAAGNTAVGPSLGSEQFGLAIDNATSGNRLVNYDNDAEVSQGGNTNNIQYDYGVDDVTAANNGALDPTAATGWAAYGVGTMHAHNPQLAPLAPTAQYGSGGGLFNPRFDTISGTAFAFDTNSNTVPVAIATESSQVVDCVTAKMRYFANIAATTPAGIYTTKINYVASPQY